MGEVELPENLVRATGETSDGSSRRRWLDELPALVDLALRWSLELGRPFQPGGETAWVAPARTATGRDRVLKVGWRHDEALHEAEGLRAWDGCGAVRVLAAEHTGWSSVLLLEACQPGVHLHACLPAQQQDEVVAGLLRRLWITPPAGGRFRSLERMCHGWAQEFTENYARLGADQPRLEAGLARAGIERFADLPRTATDSVLLVTDAHPGNVLAATREPWLLVDPKPHVGDPAYDALQHMLNFPDRLVADPLSFTRRMAGLLDLDADQLRQWVFARCVQEFVQQPLLGSVAVALAP